MELCLSERVSLKGAMKFLCGFGQCSICLCVTMARFCGRRYICVVLFAMPACKAELDTQPTDSGHRSVHLQASRAPGYETRRESAAAPGEAPMSEDGPADHCVAGGFYGHWRWHPHPFHLRYTWLPFPLGITIQHHISKIPAD